MKHRIVRFSFAAIFMICGAIQVSWAQNGRSKGLETMIGKGKIEYSMSVGPIKAGQATLSVSETTWNGQPAYRIEMVAATNKTASKIYYMNDTLRSIVLPNLNTAWYWKHSREENYEAIEQATVSGGSVKLGKNRISKGTVQEKTIGTDAPVHDMLSILLSARTIDTSKLTKGQRKEYQIIDGIEVIPVALEYQGRTKIKAAGQGTECNVFAVIQTKVENGKTRQTELMKLYFEANSYALPAGIDISLGLGAAKARML